MARLSESQWSEIRRVWETEPDEPSFTVAAERAASRFGFKPPNKVSVMRRKDAAAAAGYTWERRATLAGINAAAQRKADAAATRNAESNAVTLPVMQAAREESEDLRATVIGRHRQEWVEVAALRDEAIALRHEDLSAAYGKARFAKITAEVVKLQQDGERKAWGLDDMGDFDPSKMTNEQLEAIVRGR
ncbi:MAG: hypothetical protein WCO00_17305 [Rhodospirillaceae bacterium]